MRMREDKAICLSLSVVSFACVLTWCIVIAIMGCDRPYERNSNQPGDGVVIVQWFYSSSCSPCERQKPLVERIMKDVWYNRYDIHECQSFAERHNVSVVPTYVVTVDGKETGRAYNPHDLRKLLRK